ncbi:hypothetical protein V8J82_17800 [Gymnodinialimonas sp. 2305UL16-5]|uniref:hypothetical protein n=1 Tax=Gymnodinialimonas mytili TaxID=3126503 RepID=UPI003096CB42
MPARIALAILLGSATSPAMAQTGVDALFDLLCGRTTHFYDGQGNQIEYSAGDGTAYLWFNGIEDVIVGTWGVYETDEGPQVCYQYPPLSFAAEEQGSTHCFTETALFETVVQGGSFNGDRYGLRDGEPPYLLPAHPFQPLESFDADFPRLPPEPLCGVPIS